MVICTNEQTYSTVTIRNILSVNKMHRMILLSGPGGMGKTYMMEQAAFLWCQNQIWPSIKFVFLFRFRNINHMQGYSLKQLLEEQYKEVFQHIIWNELITIGENIVVLFDGLDEYIGLNELKFHDSDTHQIPRTAIMELLYPRKNTLPGHYLIITGRPSAKETLYEKSILTSDPIYFKVYKMLGFNDVQVNEYIHTFKKEFPDTTSAMNELNKTLYQST